jgi:ribulose-5-phosphate 4-epimerase/fuculose-1-phosphate aldolase
VRSGLRGRTGFIAQPRSRKIQTIRSKEENQTTIARPTLDRPPAAPIAAAEWRTRVDLATFYRLAAYYRMDDLIYNHLSARVPDEPGRYLVNSFGLLFEEITASNLVKLDFDGTLIAAPEGSPGCNIAVPGLHGAILEARPDLACVAHVHTPEGMAVSAMDCGLLPLTQTALGLGRISYHDYGDLMGADGVARMIRDLGDNDILILRNHGLVAAGRTIPEAFLNLYNLVHACKAQVAAMAAGVALRRPPESVIASNVGRSSAWLDRAGGPRDAGNCLEWRAALRMLDRRDTSYRK